MKPLSIRHGSVVVKIYSTPGPKYPCFTVAYSTSSGRQRITRSSLNAARAEAERIAAQLASGVCPLEMTPADQKEWLEAKALCGGNVLEAVKIAARLAKECAGADLGDMINHWNRTRAKIDAKATGEILGEMLLSKRQDGLSKRHLEGLESTLTRFAKRFPGPLADVTGPQVDAWLRDSDLAPVTRGNYVRSISILATFAKSKGYLPADWAECAKIATGKAVASTVQILTREQLVALLTHCSPCARLYIAIGAWAGIRSAEIARLRWSDIGAEYITVRAENAKTAARRLVPVLPPLRKMIDAADRSKPIIERRFPACYMHEESRRAGLGEWPRNALRHSFCSYRLAATQNAAQVALEAGNSPAMIFKHYRELVTPAKAVEWFAVLS